MQYLTIDLKQLESYSTFETVEEMDRAIYEHIDAIRHDVPESTINVLRFFGRSSLRILGVSFAAYKTIADKLGVSKSTIKRAVKTLRAFGIIETIPTVKGWKKSVNIIRICRKMTPQDEPAGTSDETNGGNASGDQNEKEPLHNNHLQQESNNNKRSTLHNPNNKIKTIIRYFALKLQDKVRNGDNIENLAAYTERVLKAEERKANYYEKQRQHAQMKQKAERMRFESFVRRTFGDPFEDLGDFAKAEARRMYRQATRKPKFPFYNWLEA